MNPFEEDCFWYNIHHFEVLYFPGCKYIYEFFQGKKPPRTGEFSYHFWNFSITKVVPLILLAAWKLPKLAWSREASVSHMMPFLEMCWGYIWWNPWPTYTTKIWPTLQAKIRMSWKGSHGLKRRSILYIYTHLCFKKSDFLWGASVTCLQSNWILKMPSELGKGWNGTLCLVMNGARAQKDLKDLVLVAACVACVFSCFWVG